MRSVATTGRFDNLTSANTNLQVNNHLVLLEGASVDTISPNTETRVTINDGLKVGVIEQISEGGVTVEGVNFEDQDITGAWDVSIENGLKVDAIRSFTLPETQGVWFPVSADTPLVRTSRLVKEPTNPVWASISVGSNLEIDNGRALRTNLITGMTDPGTSKVRIAGGAQLPSLTDDGSGNIHVQAHLNVDTGKIVYSDMVVTDYLQGRNPSNDRIDVDSDLKILPAWSLSTNTIRETTENAGVTVANKLKVPTITDDGITGNIGVDSHLILTAGKYVSTPIALVDYIQGRDVEVNTVQTDCDFKINSGKALVTDFIKENTGNGITMAHAVKCSDGVRTNYIQSNDVDVLPVVSNSNFIVNFDKTLFANTIRGTNLTSVTVADPLILSDVSEDTTATKELVVSNSGTVGYRTVGALSRVEFLEDFTLLTPGTNGTEFRAFFGFDKPWGFYGNSLVGFRVVMDYLGALHSGYKSCSGLAGLCIDNNFNRHFGLHSGAGFCVDNGDIEFMAHMDLISGLRMHYESLEVFIGLAANESSFVDGIESYPFHCGFWCPWTYILGADNNNWLTVANNNESHPPARTYDSGVPARDGTLKKLKFKISGNTIAFYINGSLVTTETYSFTTGTVLFPVMGVKMAQSAIHPASNRRGLALDYVHVKQDFDRS